MYDLGLMAYEGLMVIKCQIIYIYIHIYIYIYIQKIWHLITIKRWYAIKPNNQPKLNYDSDRTVKSFAELLLVIWN